MNDMAHNDSEEGWSMPWKSPNPARYPHIVKDFRQVAQAKGSESPHMVPASSWTGEHLIYLRILANCTEFNHVKGMSAAGVAVTSHKRLMTALHALDESQLRQTDQVILKILREKDCAIMFTFYVMIRELLATPYRPGNPKAVALDPHNLRPRKPKPADATTNETADASTDTDKAAKDKPPSRAAKFDEAAYVPPKSQGDTRKPVDEFVTTSGSVSLSSSLIAIWFEGRSQPKAGEAVLQATVAQTYYPVNMTLGYSGCRTDGSIHVVYVGELGITHSRDTDMERVVDIEAKANEATELLPQHVTELIGHMEHRLKRLAPKMKKDVYKSYRDMSAEQRTVYLLCFNGVMFRIVWMTFRPSYLEWIFGPLNDIREGNRKFYGKLDKPNPNMPADDLYQTVNIGNPRSLADEEGRLYAATIIIYFLMTKLPTEIKKSEELDADILGCYVKNLHLML